MTVHGGLLPLFTSADPYFIVLSGAREISPAPTIVTADPCLVCDLLRWPTGRQSPR